MEASDIAKLAASVAAGAITYDVATSLLGGNRELSLLDSLIAGAASGVVGSIAGEVMDATGVSEIIDDVAGEVGGFLEDLF